MDAEPRIEIDLLLAAAAAVPDTAAVRLGDQTVTYGGLRALVAAQAQRLQAEGAQSADVVGLLLDNSIEFVVGYFAVQWLGAVAMPLNPKEGVERLRYCIDCAGARWVLVAAHADLRQAPYADLQGVRFVAVDAPPRADTVTGEGNPAPMPDRSPVPEDLALIMFTTGTTGAPKGVRLRHQNTLAAVRGIRAVMQVPAATVEVVPTPLFHSFALARMRVVFACRGTLVLSKGFVFPSSVLNLVERSGAQGFASVPAGWEILLSVGPERFAQAFRQVRYAEIGSAAMPMAVKQRLIDLLPHTRLYYHYGLTEASRSVFVELHQSAGDLHILGRALPGVEVSIRDSSGNDVAAGEEGEICVRGPTVFAGYLGDDQTTQGSFFGPWLRTGDLGRRDAAGGLRLSGRLKEMINLGGSKLSPADIESVLNDCAGVQESAVIGVADGGTSTERIHAFVVATAIDGCSLSSLQQHAASKLDPLRRPAHYHFVDTLPKTESGKLQRLRLRPLVVPRP